eukprot:5198466-Pyramimonas_sp.AAC.1
MVKGHAAGSKIENRKPQIEVIESEREWMDGWMVRRIRKLFTASVAASGKDPTRTLTGRTRTLTGPSRGPE